VKREIGWEAISRDSESVLTVGTFDGVHRGHQAIIDYLLRRAGDRSAPSTVVSFDPHPRSVVHGDSVSLVTTVEERADLLESMGLHRFVVIPFSKEFASLTPEEYVSDILVDRIGLQEITVGYDHRFGKGRQGDVTSLKELGTQYGFDVDVISPQEVGQDVVSSTAIRECLKQGRVQRARELLGRPYELSGRIGSGEGRGRQLGYPTANIILRDARKVVPERGVYAVRVRLPSGQKKGGMLNIGRRPTFDEMNATVEVHVFDFDGDLYDESLSVQFMQRLRDEQKFESPNALAVQLSKDERHCKRVLGLSD